MFSVVELDKIVQNPIPEQYLILVRANGFISIRIMTRFFFFCLLKNQFSHHFHYNMAIDSFISETISR